MAILLHNRPFGGAFARRFTRYSGLFFDQFATNSAWMRETAVIRLPPVADVGSLVLRGEFRAHPGARGVEAGFPELDIFVDGRSAGSYSAKHPGPWEATFKLDPGCAERGSVIYLTLRGTGLTNALAWLGRVTKLPFFQRYRAQNKNRQLRIFSIASDAGELIYDFSKRESPYCASFGRAHTRTGMNVVGFLTADLGIGESARSMARAADAASIPLALVPLKLNCINRMGDLTYADRLQDSNPHGVNVFHIDPPVARDIDHHHGPEFMRDKFNIGYFAWELPEFPDAWMAVLRLFRRDLVPEQLRARVDRAQGALPGSFDAARDRIRAPEGGHEAPSRSRFGLPQDRFLFLSLFDLNSYTARKNPRAVIEAFRRSGLATRGSALVLKVHNAEANPSDFAALNESVRDLPGTVVLSGTFPRADVYALEAACDCFVSLHRSEGFGFAVAESMYLGKPVISTNWSATAEYLDSGNGFPVHYSLVTLSENNGPYTKGSTWADPDPEHASWLMQKVSGDPSGAAQLGAAARRTVEERFSPAVIGARYRKRLEAIAYL